VKKTVVFSHVSKQPDRLSHFNGTSIELGGFFYKNNTLLYIMMKQSQDVNNP
jgi:hypothetical protein